MQGNNGPWGMRALTLWCTLKLNCLPAYAFAWQAQPIANPCVGMWIGTLMTISVWQSCAGRHRPQCIAP